MASPSDRRQFLKTLASAAGFGLLPGLAHFTAGRLHAQTSITTSQLAPNVFAIFGAGSTAVVVYGPDEILLVDGGRKARAAGVLAAIRQLGGNLPIRTVFNTHWHPEGTGLNQALGSQGARIIAHENTRLWMTIDVDLEWQDRVIPPAPIEALPNDTFFDGGGSINFAGQRIEYALMPQAHTDGDIYVFMPDSNVLVAGDIVSVGSYPILDYSSGGWVRGITQATQTLLDIANDQTQIVPAIGPVQTRAQLETQGEMLTTVSGRLIEMMRKGYSADDMLAEDPTLEYDLNWGNPELFIRNAYPGLWGHARELGGII